MSFLAPKTELPNSLADNTPGRNARLSPTQVAPLVLGRGRVVAQWVTPVLHWHYRSTERSQYAFFSGFAWLCLGPVDEFVQLIVNGKLYYGIFKFRSDYPGTDYVDQVVAKETPETFRLWWGLEDNANYSTYLQSLVLDAAHPMAGKAHPAYHGICALAVKDMEAGQSTGGQTPSLPKIEVELYRRSPAGYSFGYAAHGTHPMGIARDILTLQRGGLKLPASYFDDAHWTAQMEALVDDGLAGATGDELFTSHVFAEPKQADEQLSDVLSYFDGYLVERDGKLRIGYSPNDGSTLDPGGLTVISQHHLAGEIEDEPGELDGLPSQVVVTGLDWEADPPLSEASETAQVPFAQRFLGEQRPPRSYNRPGYVTRQQLKSSATLTAAIIANPDWEATIPVLRQYAVQPDATTPLRPGDLFVLNTDQVGGASMVVRILSRESDTPVEVVFRVRRERGTFPKPYEPVLDTRASTTPPVPADLARYGVAQMPPDLSDAADTRICALVERPGTSAQGFRVEFSPTDTWPGQELGNANPRWAVACVLDGALASGLTATTITVNTVGVDWDALATSRSALEQADDQLLLYHAGEWLSIGTITPLGGGAYTLAVTRARLASLPAAHDDASVLFVIPRGDLIGLTHADFANVESGGSYDAGVATKYFKLRPYNAAGDGDPTAATSLVLRDPTPDAVTGLAVSFSGRAARLTWAKVAGALVSEYQIWRATGPGYADEALVAEVGATSFMDVVPDYDVTYRWRIRAMATDETEGIFSAPITGTAVVLDEDDLDPDITAAIADALAAAATAIADAADAQGTADGKVTTFVQTSAPTAEGVGDLWLDSDDGNKLYRWSGSAWVNLQDAGIVSALDAAGIAQAEAESKVITFYQTAAPTAEAVGDLWVDTDDGNRLYRWSGSAWVDVQGIRTNVPATPDAPTFDAEDNYLADDGTAFAYIQIYLPAMPAGAVLLNVLYRRNGSGGWLVGDQRAAGGGVARIDDLSIGVSYQFAVQGLSNFGIASAVSGVLTRTAPNGVASPAAPANLTATGYLENVTLDWDDNNEKNLAGYEVWRHTANDSGAASKIATPTSSNYIDLTVAAATTYYYWVKARTRGGQVSGFSAGDSATRGEQTGGGGGGNFTLALTGHANPLYPPTGAGSYPAGTVVAISTPDPAGGDSFINWTSGNPFDMDFVESPSSASTYVLMTKDISLIANY